MEQASSSTDWRGQRLIGIGAIAASLVGGGALWIAVRYHAPIPQGMADPVARLVFALKCCVLACIFGLAMGIEAVAHERLQTAAFDPLAGPVSRRLQVNQRYLQNTLEQFVLFAMGLLGLAIYAPDGDAMRAVTASTASWIATRLVFWIGYHRSAALRALGAWSLLVSQIMLLYVGFRIGGDMAGPIGAWAILGAVLLFEAALFWLTRERRSE
ncbi:MAG: MAPEG family protein [Sphingobium sp.]|nr:MAPEG family protein [Sphingobium sp.]